MRLLTNLLFEPKGMHDQNAAYSIKDTVMSGDGSRVYFAIQDVPAGIPLNDSNYWKLQIDLSGSKSAMDQALASFADYAKVIGMRVRGETAGASGNPVTFLPDAGSLLQPVTVLEPQQQGSGDPSPSNIRPIIGYDKLNLGAAGKNLLPTFENYTLNGITMTAAADGTITLNGTSTGYGFTYLIQELNLPAGSYALSLNNGTAVGSSVADTVYCVARDAANGWTVHVYCVQSNTVGVGTTEMEIVDFMLVVPAGVTLNNYKMAIQLEAGSTVTEWKPHQGKLHTVQIGQTVYGFRYEWLTGKGVIEWALATLTGDETDWALSASGNFYSYNVVRNLGSDEGYCSHYKTTNDLGSADAAIAFYAGDTAAIRDSRFMSVADWKAFLTAQNAAGTPVQIAYKLATPIEIQLTPHIISAADPEQVNTLYGDSRIDVEYVKPLHVSIEERVAAAVAAAKE